MKNLHHIFTIIFILFYNLLIQNNIFAQSQNGYIITKGGGIKNGKVELVYRFFEGGFIRFKEDRGKKTKLQAEDIEGFGLGDTTYIAILNLDFTPPNSNREIKSDFVKVLVDDELCLYQFIYKKEQVWGATPKDCRFILKKSNEKKLYWLSEDISQMEVQLKEYFKEYPSLQNTLNINGINQKNMLGSLTNYVRLYNKLAKDN